MQSKAQIQTAVEESVTNVANPQVIGEWTMTRYTTIKDNFPQTNETTAQLKEGADLQYNSLFPVDSVVKQYRDPGIVYSTLYSSYSASYPGADENKLVKSPKVIDWNIGEAKRTNNRTYARGYLAGRDNQFQYWISSAKTLAKTDANSRTPGQFSCNSVASSRGLAFDIEFDTTIPANKIVAKFNTHIGNPQGVSFSIKQGGSWTQVATGLNVPNSGILEVYRPVGGGTWTSTPVYYTEAAANSTDIDGIRVQVNSMQRTTPVSSTVENAVNASLEIVEFTPRLAVDLTSRTLNYNVNNEIANNDLADSLIGTVSSNTGEITFMNNDGFFDTTTSAGILTNRLDDNVEFTVDLIYDARIGGTLAQRTVRQLTMVSDVWSSGSEEEVTVSLMDYSRPLQEAKAQETLVANIPAYAAIWLLCDGIGFNRVSVGRSTADEDDLMMEYFWASPKQTVWEMIQEIAKSYQLAAFFDEFGTLKVYTRKYLWDRNSATTAGTPTDLTLYGVANGNKLSNINTLNRTDTKIINKAIVSYKALNKYNYSGIRNKKKSMNSIVWKAEDDMTIGAAEIVQAFAQGATQIKIDPRYDDALFKYSGKFVVEDTGRIFEYQAKKYQYTNGSTVWVKSENDMQAAIETNNGIRPVFTGWIQLTNPAGGALNSVLYDFRESWQSMRFTEGSASGTNDFGPMKFVKLSSGKEAGGALSITTSFAGGARYKVWKKSQTYDKYDRVGIKFKMIRGADPEVGVVLFPQGTNAAGGYHVSVVPDDIAGVPHIIVNRVSGAGNSTQIPFDPANEYEGPKIKKGRWYYLEAVIFGNEKDWQISVFVNGNFVGTWRDSSANALPRTQKAQFFTKGEGRIYIDKFYVVNTRGKKGDRKGDEHNITRKDLLYNRKLCPGDKQFKNYLSDYLRKKYDARLWVYNFNSAGFATAREIAHYTAEFEVPAIRQWLYISNKNVHDVMYKKRPLGATFTLKNTSEQNQLIMGTRKTKVSGADHDESTFIRAHVFRLQEPQKVEYSDKDSINRVGENAFEIEATWIQTRSAAVELGEFVRARFGVPGRNYQMEIYGNPLVQLGDIVAVYWPGKKLASYTYIVSSVDHSFNEGLTTNIGLIMRQEPIPAEAKVFDASVDQDEMIPPLFSQISAYTYQP